MSIKVASVAAALSMAAADPERPHLAQAWTAQSIGDGLKGEIGDESYINNDEIQAHWWKYGDQCQKLVHCGPNGENGFTLCTAYYLKCDAVNCCKCDNADFKSWDIETGFFTKASFVGFEDTKELNDNPVHNAEHWHQATSLPKILGVTYEYFLTRAENADLNVTDIISHRIDYGASTNVSGSILYGNFEVQHDLESFKQAFSVPSQCIGNILKCGCDGLGVSRWDAKYFKHHEALRHAKQNAVAV